jgi:hypothetical protein
MQVVFLFSGCHGKGKIIRRWLKFQPGRLTPEAGQFNRKKKRTNIELAKGEQALVCLRQIERPTSHNEFCQSPDCSDQANSQTRFQVSGVNILRTKPET